MQTVVGHAAVRLFSPLPSPHHSHTNKSVSHNSLQSACCVPQPRTMGRPVRCGAASNSSLRIRKNVGHARPSPESRASIPPSIMCVVPPSQGPFYNSQLVCLMNEMTTILPPVQQLATSSTHHLRTTPPMICPSPKIPRRLLITPPWHIAASTPLHA